MLLVCLLALHGWALQVAALVTAAEQVGITLGYAYRCLSDPKGDVPRNTGVCSDAVIRALRQQGLNLQRAVHQDMRRTMRAGGRPRITLS